MEFSKLSSLYFIVSFLGLASYWGDNMILSIVFRTLGLGVLLYHYWKHVKEENHLLFYLSIAFVAIGEALVIYGYQNEAVQVYLIISFITYYWLTFFLLRDTVRESTIKFSRINWTAFILFLLLIGYLAFNFISMMISEMMNTLPFVLGSLISFVSLCVYCLIIYFNKKSFRNFWLVLFVTTIILAQSTIPLEALYFNSVHLKTLGFVAEILGHYFVFQYLVTPENEIVLEQNNNYL